MDTFTILSKQFTLFQAFFLLPISAFVITELKRWNKMNNINESFVFLFIFRCIFVMVTFIYLTQMYIFLFSFISITAIVINTGGFYKETPEYATRKYVEDKQKTIIFTIPWQKSGQVLLWFLIDVGAFYLLMIIAPLIASNFFFPNDPMLWSRLF